MGSNTSSMSNSKTRTILLKSDQEQVRKYATPRAVTKVSSATAQRAKSMLSNGYTYAEVASAIGESVGSIRGLVTSIEE